MVSSFWGNSQLFRTLGKFPVFWAMRGSFEVESQIENGEKLEWKKKMK